jgi:hypothetical protein
MARLSIIMLLLYVVLGLAQPVRELQAINEASNSGFLTWTYWFDRQASALDAEKEQLLLAASRVKRKDKIEALAKNMKTLHEEVRASQPASVADRWIAMRGGDDPAKFERMDDRELDNEYIKIAPFWLNWGLPTIGLPKLEYGLPKWLTGWGSSKKSSDGETQDSFEMQPSDMV